MSVCFCLYLSGIKCLFVLKLVNKETPQGKRVLDLVCLWINEIKLCTSIYSPLLDIFLVVFFIAASHVCEQCLEGRFPFI